MTTSIGASELGRKVPAEAVDADLVREARALMPGATLAFARRFDRPLLAAGTDQQGRFVLALGGSVVNVVGVGPDGEILWQHELFTPRYNPMVEGHPDFLEVGLNGSAHLVYGVDEEVARHVVIDPKGQIAFDDTLDTPGDGGWPFALSPCGHYFYERRQGADEVELRRVNGPLLNLELPLWRGSGPPLPHRPTTVTFIARHQVLATTNFEGGAIRRLLIDLSGASPVVIAIETPPTRQWRRLVNSSYGTIDGDLLIAERWTESPTSDVARYGPDGRLLWKTDLDRWSGSMTPARDRPIAAILITMSWPWETPKGPRIKTIDMRTGRLVDSAAVWPDQSRFGIDWIREKSFDRGRLLMAVHGGRTGNEDAFVRVAIDGLGRIGASELRESWVWGLSRDHPMFGMAASHGDTTCTVAGFRK